MSEEQSVTESTETAPSDGTAETAESESVTSDAASPGSSGEESTRNLGVILDLDLPLTVRFGQTHLPLGSLVEMGPGTVVNLDRTPSDPVEVLVNNVLWIARSESSVEGHADPRFIGRP